MTACPHSRAPQDAGDRKALPAGETPLPDIEERDGRWHVRSLALVREILRAGGATKQSGFAVEVATQSLPLKRWPVLYADGPVHREQRSKIARFFAPAVVDRDYRDLVTRRAEAFLTQFDDGHAHDLGDIALHFSTQVAARVIGLTASDQERMAWRLAAFFDQPDSMLGELRAGWWARVKTAPETAQQVAKLGWFFLKDVRPAIRSHRDALKAATQGGAEPPDDVITHLIGEGYSDLEILMECLTYGAAGMVTTREFLHMATWHLVEKDDLRRRFLSTDSAGRRAILHEILRLEPVVGHLYRRSQDELRLVDSAGTEHVIPAGARLQLYVRQANSDAGQLGDDAESMCPGRDLPRGVRPEVMSFGDGVHRCPGNSIAILESEIFLERLFRRNVSMMSTPRIEWEDVVAGYAVRGLLLTAPREAATTA